MKWVDLRSDTVTCPTPAMRKAMAEAEVGDDVYGEDPTVNRLQERAAEILGKEAGLLVTSGTQGNLVAVLAQCPRGTELIEGNQGHTYQYEAGGVAALGGVHPYPITNQPDGTLRLEDIEGAIRGDDVHYPVTRLIILENTQNRCGGTPLPVDYMQAVGNLAHRRNIRLHLDGARLFNAAVALHVPAAALAVPADSVTVCLSKGLCAPVGSVLCGSREFIAEARRVRKQLGGGMRQAGILAAAGLVALNEMIDRLVEDHARAQKLAQQLAEIPGVRLEPGSPATNMIFLTLGAESGISLSTLVERLKAQGVLAGISANRLRLVLHHDVDDTDVNQAVAAFRAALPA
jgi:threonine aldolase